MKQTRADMSRLFHSELAATMQSMMLFPVSQKGFG